MNTYNILLKLYGISQSVPTFTFMHLAHAFIQSELQCIQVIHLLSVCVEHCELNPCPLRC